MYATVIIRTFLIYALITIVYRFIDQRAVRDLGVIDWTISILIAILASHSIEHLDQSIFLSIVPILLLIGMQKSILYRSFKNRKVRNVFEKEPSVLIDRGKVHFSELVKQHYHLDDLFKKLRSKGIKNIEEVDYAILETNGKLSVFSKDGKAGHDYPLALILDGKIQPDTLRQISKTEAWLHSMLDRERVRLEDIFYGFYREKQLYIIKNSELIKK